MPESLNQIGTNKLEDEVVSKVQSDPVKIRTQPGGRGIHISIEGWTSPDMSLQYDLALASERPVLRWPGYSNVEDRPWSSLLWTKDVLS